MASPSDDDRSTLFGSMLPRLDRTIECLRSGAEAVDELLRTWEVRWQQQHERILERLRTIDGHLARVAIPVPPSRLERDPQNGSTPRFGVIGAPVDASSMRSMVE